MGSIIAHRIDYNGVGVLRGQQQEPENQEPVSLKFAIYTPDRQEPV